MNTTTLNKPVIVLDAGKVLVDFDLNLFFTELSRLIEKNAAPPTWENLEGLYMPLELGIGSIEDAARSFNDAVGLTLDPDQWQKLWCRVFVGEVEGMREALSGLKDRFRLVVLSNTMEAHWEFVINQYGIFDLLDGWVVSYKERMAKPDPAVYRIVQDRYCNGAPPFFYTDDLQANIDAARKLGWEAELFCDAAHFRSEVAKRCRSAGICRQHA
jgi:FMN phosphatase YigB (HAD superfamily)